MAVGKCKCWSGMEVVVMGVVALEVGNGLSVVMVKVLSGRCSGTKMMENYWGRINDHGRLRNTLEGR